MNLTEALQERLANGRPFGFNPWKDGEDALWGTLLKLDSENMRVQELGTLGELEEIEEYALDKITSFDFSERYAERLVRLATFVPTRSQSTHYEADAAIIGVILLSLVQSQEFARVQLFSGENSTVQVLSLVDGWVTMRDYDDLGVPYGIIVHRISNILEVREGTAYEEADAFLEKMNSLNDI
jgi:hypothetical protein